MEHLVLRTGSMWATQLLKEEGVMSRRVSSQITRESGLELRLNCVCCFVLLSQPFFQRNFVTKIESRSWRRNLNLGLESDGQRTRDPWKEGVEFALRCRKGAPCGTR